MVFKYGLKLAFGTFQIRTFEYTSPLAYCTYVAQTKGLPVLISVSPSYRDMRLGFINELFDRVSFIIQSSGVFTGQLPKLDSELFFYVSSERDGHLVIVILQAFATQ